MKNVRYIIVHKRIGQTPYERIIEFKKEYTSYKNITISYAGRLDPMARGKLLLLIGDENKKRHIYEKLDKSYYFNILFGISTDSLDILGIVKHVKNYPKIHINTLKETLDHVKKSKWQIPPKFSSVYYRGKPLYFWAKNYPEKYLKINTRKIKIYKFDLVKLFFINSKELEKTIYKNVWKVHGDFRQNEIIKSWKAFFRTNKAIRFPVVKLHTICSSGTYIRSIANDIGKKMNIPTLTLNINRTKIHIPKKVNCTINN
jgi:tRNA pseudouridine55 synthase